MTSRKLIFLFCFPLSLQTKGSYDFSLQSFHSYSDYMDYTMKERSTKTTISIGFSFPGVFEFGFNFADAKYTKSVQKIRRASGKVRPPPYHLWSPKTKQTSRVPQTLSTCCSEVSNTSLLRLTASSGPKQSWSWPSTFWKPRIWCFTPSSCSACAPCLSPTFMGSTGRSTEIMVPTTSQRQHSEETTSTPSSWTRRNL